MRLIPGPSHRGLACPLARAGYPSSGRSALGPKAVSL